MSEWKRYKLSELYEMSSGISSTKEQAGHGSPFLSFSVVFNNYFLPDSLIDLMDTTDGEKQKYSINEGDIFLTRTSETVDELAMSSVALKDYPEASFSGFLKRLRPVDKTIVYPKFMAFYLRSPLFRRTIINNTVMTLRASFNEAMFSYLEIMLPDFDTQKKIGDFLYSLEKKKQINNQINQELEAMAKTLYNYWFVQFDFPDQNGKTYKSSGGKMVYHPELKREIPEGWGVEKLKYFSKYVSDKVESSELNIENYVGTDNMIVDMGGIELTTSIPKSGTSTKYSIGDILISNIRPYFKKIWLSDRVGGCSSDVLCIRTKKIVSREFVFATLARDDFFNYDVAGSKGSKMPRGDKKHIMEYPIVFDFEIADQFSKIVRPIYEAVHKNYIQNQELIQLRDWLLPMLMNGQVKVE